MGWRRLRHSGTSGDAHPERVPAMHWLADASGETTGNIQGIRKPKLAHIRTGAEKAGEE